MIRHQFGQVEFASEHWFRLAATTLATRHPGRRPRHAREAARRAHPPDRPRRDQRADGQPDPRPARGRDQAGARRRSPTTTDRPGRPSTASPRSSTSASPTRPRRRPRRCSPVERRRPGRGPRPAGRRARRPVVRDYDAAAHRGGLQRRPAQRHGGPGVRPERQAPPGLLGPREPDLSRRARRRASPRPAGPGLHRRTRTSRSRCATSRWSWPRTGGPAGRSASSACSGRPG